MSPIALVADSTVYMPQELVEQYRIHIVPVRIIWEGKTYRDGIDITPREIYQRLKTSDTLPTTSQPPAQDFLEVFKKLHQQGYDILTITLSSGLSGTFGSAQQAKEMLPEARIEVVDSKMVAMATGFQILAVARALEENPNMTLEEAKALAEKAREHTNVLFVVDTLEYLHRGGRIGGAARFLGTMLNLKPLLTLEDGKIVPAGKVRTMRKALSRLLDLLEERIAGRRPVRLAALHVDAEEASRKLMDMAIQRFQPEEIYYTTVSPAVGVHLGPGTLGLCYMAGL